MHVNRNMYTKREKNKVKYLPTYYILNKDTVLFSNYQIFFINFLVN